MRIAVFSDIHGNLQALKSALEQIREKTPDKIVFLAIFFKEVMKK
ncbi:MAG: metallophosphatase family protein [Lachnospiraceae bacterium]|nr:metallophosphatase family protein [Lachnospiraceae bacterium]